MPAEFNSCVSSGGKVITKKINKNKYINVCYMNGKSYAGEIKNYKSVKNGK